jgi:hypothetical protein
LYFFDPRIFFYSTFPLPRAINMPILPPRIIRMSVQLVVSILEQLMYTSEQKEISMVHSCEKGL